MFIDPVAEAQMKSIDFAFDRLFRKPSAPAHKPESDELAQLIAEETDRALHSDAAWDRAYSDLDESARTPLLRKASTGDDMDAGQKLIRAIRRLLIASATQLAQDKFNGDA